jgi:hypothetical protein
VISAVDEANSRIGEMTFDRVRDEDLTGVRCRGDTSPDMHRETTYEFVHGQAFTDMHPKPYSEA